MPAPNHLRVLLSDPPFETGPRDRAFYRTMPRSGNRADPDGALGPFCLRMIGMARLHVPDEGIKTTPGWMDSKTATKAMVRASRSKTSAPDARAKPGADPSAAPGDPTGQSPRAANSVAQDRSGRDLVAWEGGLVWSGPSFGFPRMLHDRSPVYLEERAKPMRAVPLDKLNGWARAATRRRTGIGDRSARFCLQQAAISRVFPGCPEWANHGLGAAQEKHDGRGPPRAGL